jgi:hypothetical protein
MPILAPFILVPLYALADRFTGGGWPKLDAALPGRSVFWASLVLAGAGWLVGGAFGALCALAWFIYRTPAWGMFGGSIDARTSGQAIGMFVRHLLWAPLLAVCAYWGGHPWPIVVGGAVVYAVAASLVAVWFGAQTSKHIARGEPGGDENTVAELARGALAGLTVAALVIWS